MDIPVVGQKMQIIRCLRNTQRISQPLIIIQVGHNEPIPVGLKKIQFVGGRYGSKPYLVMVEAVKGGKPHTEIMETIYNVKEDING